MTDRDTATDRDAATGGDAAADRDGERAVTSPGGPHAPAGRAAAGTGFPGPWVPRAPRLWIEIVLIALSYWVYSLIRNAVPEQRDAAMANAHRIWSLEQSLGIAVEDAVNRAANSVTWLIVGMNYYYATLHFVVTLGVLVWLFRAHSGRYAAARLVLFSTTAVALVGYYFFPLAPPRLMEGGRFVDTVVVHHTWGSMASGDLANVSNQYAAMPSMHVGWSVWCGVVVALIVRRRWVRVLAVLYPATTLLVIVCTANHFWLDAVGGLLCLAFGFTTGHLVYRTPPWHLPRLPELPGTGRVPAPAGRPDR
ncbi:phosphatase PAP2 family protein [Streptomyces sp. HB2AG]|nr:phosphatase PAP2 family protein [Streptomyces sp. HB2AG]MCZ2524545.1 phosphatase PAP2 family protein [Streptomyces sp. HB2AG]